MKNSFNKLKKLLLQDFRAQGFASKYSCLKRKKWFFLKNLKNLPVFFNAVLFFSKELRNNIKFSLKRRKNLIHRGKLFFLKTKTKYLKNLLFLFSLSLKKAKQFRTLKLTNFTERRLVVLLMRVGFFSKVSLAVIAIKRGDVFINNKKVFQPFFLLRLGSLISVRGKARKFVLSFGFHQLFLLSKVKIGVLTPLHVLRSSITFSNKKQGAVARSKQHFFFQNLIIELFFLEDFLFRFRKSSNKFVGVKSFQSSWPIDFIKSDIPSFLVVDYQATCFCLKHAVDVSSMVVVSKNYLPPLNFSKI